MPRSLVLAFVALAALGACSSNPDPELVPDQSVRQAPPDQPIKPGDCVEAMRRATLNPDLYVDRLPSPTVPEASAINVKTMPSAVRKARYSEIRTSVLVDTLGKADMKTFEVLKSTHPWLTQSVKAALAKWTFEPAQVAGCRVPRHYLYNLHSGKR